jgi:hypothetical protein
MRSDHNRRSMNQYNVPEDKTLKLMGSNRKLVCSFCIMQLTCVSFGSECGSISIHNTLLAMEDTAPPPRKIIHNVDDREMSIDSRQLYDPDSLWKRRQQT